ncbi:hypothetical protein DUNSADRAFT_13112 [Dunaliella salina]|uniref:Encoded protein n=1 Tax=Dunaliella salina TaxID=3046 RepID=A0ABQ7GA59_DUNSA|nr:hypothetical protein DUNSADRAFT_13112 [Dunaliella salina]|eukprot:KAF5831458.1 hypothetical protein DUNSADRAFT_13112 [Dunaliella salina]
MSAPAASLFTYSPKCCSCCNRCSYLLAHQVEAFFNRPAAMPLLEITHTQGQMMKLEKVPWWMTPSSSLLLHSHACPFDLPSHSPSSYLLLHVCMPLQECVFFVLLAAFAHSLGTVISLLVPCNLYKT